MLGKLISILVIPVMGYYLINYFNISTMGQVLHEVKVPVQKATFGMGCFWSNDALFGGTKGVIRTVVGYSGGKFPNPTYRNLGDHTEVIQIDFDPKTITYENLLKLFWENHEYGVTTVIKRQYMSLILYHDEEQRKIAEQSLKEEMKNHKGKITTEIAPAGAFYPAEDYHQKYRLQKHAVLCQSINLTPQLLQTSYAAAKLNGFLAGVGDKKTFDDELKQLGLSQKLNEYVKKQWEDNHGNGLYC
nr:peptide methionine sulfoxide reductase isoform X1 [Onthophagus taurus]XP_022905386.1 peptide methionine sulfoxide reductase isoform X1 [Onthophagus taurus]